MISTVMPIAYDHRYAYGAIARVYDISDEIVLGLDRDRISWSGKPFDFDRELFLAQVRRIDPKGKVRLVEDNFHTEDDPMANDTRERNLLSSACADGNWIIQIDSDEYLLNPADFKAWLARADPACDVQAQWITVFKSFGDQCLVTHEPQHQVHVGTRLKNSYQYCRKTGRPAALSNLQIMHYSWGRSRHELEQKVTNWSHSRDFDTGKFLRLWDSVTLENYRDFQNFHPLHGPLWTRLSLIQLPAGLRIAA
jgi:hypothetical protein